jgi:hypothetical protein
MPGRQTYKKYKYQETPITDPGASPATVPLGVEP